MLTHTDKRASATPLVTTSAMEPCITPCTRTPPSHALQILFPNHHRTLDVLSSSARDSSPSLPQNIPHHVLAFLTERSLSSACRWIHEPTQALFPRPAVFPRLRRFYLIASTTFGSSVNERTSDVRDWLATARSTAYHRQHPCMVRSELDLYVHAVSNMDIRVWFEVVGSVSETEYISSTWSLKASHLRLPLIQNIQCLE